MTGKSQTPQIIELSLGGNKMQVIRSCRVSEVKEKRSVQGNGRHVVVSNVAHSKNSDIPVVTSLEVSISGDGTSSSLVHMISCEKLARSCEVSSEPEILSLETHLRAR